MSFFISHSKKGKTIAILDIGSASVGGALVSMKEDGVPEVFFSVREEMVFQGDLNLERFQSSMFHALDRVLNKIEKSGFGAQRKFFCALSSPWYESETKMISVKKDKPFVVTHKILDDLIKKETNLFRSSVSKAGKMNDESQIIDMKNIQIKLNGYETGDPYGKRAKNIEAALFIGLSSKKVLEAIESKVSRVFHSSKIKFSTFSLSAFSTVRDIFTDIDNFLLLDITGEVTDITLVKNDVLLETTLFPMGKNFIMRKIASGMNVTPEEVKSLLNISRTSKTDKTTQMRLGGVLHDARKEWLESFTKSIISLSKEVPLPNTIFFTADPDMASWFAESMKKEEFGKFTITNEIFDVRFLDSKMLEKFCSFKKDTEKDSFIMLESIFAARNIDTL